MDEPAVREHAQAFCAALVAGDIDRAIGDFSNELRRNLGESGRIIVFAFLEDRTCVGFITKTVGRRRVATPSIFSNACPLETESIEGRGRDTPCAFASASKFFKPVQKA